MDDRFQRVSAGRPPLPVGLDLTPASVGITGVARYSRMLWSQLARRPDVIPRAFIAGRGPSTDDGYILRVPIPVRMLQPAWRLGWPRAETFLGNVDVFHCIDMLPPPTRKPLVMSWHDTFRFAAPRYHAPRDLARRQKRVDALERASVVLTYCEATAQELVNETGYPRERIVLAPPGFDLADDDGPPPVGGPFVLAAGALTPRKGFDVLARAMALLGDDAPPLVLAGPDGHGANEVRQQMLAALPSGRLVFLGDRYDSMVSLYKHATVVCHPSLAEGFGYVCLEAMGAAAAVVAADIPSIREMGEGSIVLVPAGEAEPLAEAIASLLSDPDERERLGSRARERAASYTWDSMADQCVRAYQMAVADGH